MSENVFMVVRSWPDLEGEIRFDNSLRVLVALHWWSLKSWTKMSSSVYPQFNFAIFLSRFRDTLYVLNVLTELTLHGYALNKQAKLKPSSLILANSIGYLV